MFKPVRAPKEGRSPPGLLYAGSSVSGKRLSQRQTTIAIIVLICFILGYFVLNSEGGDISSTSTTFPGYQSSSGGLNNAVLSDNKENPPADANSHEIHAEDVSKDEKAKYRTSEDPYSNDVPKDANSARVSQQDDRQSNDRSHTVDNTKPKAVVDQDGSDAEEGNPVGWKPKLGEKPLKNGKSATPAVREKFADRPEFESALLKVLDLLPDEVHMRELTRQVESTGKERMREMGLRTRAYRKYFDAWEQLHLTSDSEGATYIRDDVIQYLRSHHQDLQGSDLRDEGIGENLNIAQTIRSYEAYRSFLQKFAELLFPWTAPYFSDHMSLHAHFKKGGRGIVLTAGDDQAPYLLTTIWSYRQLGCTLPIEVMYLGDQDLGEDYRADLEALPGVVTRDISQMTNDEGWRLAGWAAKPFAILLSSFREVIFIDADSLFFKNPEIMFDEPGYKKTGALFFKDRLIMPESKKRFLQQIFPKPIPRLAKESRMWLGTSGHMQESGVVVVDKWKHFISLLLITRFNGPDRDGNKEKGITGVYDLMYGDKETFWIGFLLAGDENYHFHEGAAGIMGEMDQQKPDLRKRDELDPIEDNTESPAEDPDTQSLTAVTNSDTKTESSEETLSTDVARESEPESYTICAPQLLHFDIHGKPLWFNGWLLHNKFAEKSKKRFADFKSYLVEPAELRDPGQWQLAESNMCCLTTDADKKFDFDEKELATLDMIMKRAAEMGMGDQQ